METLNTMVVIALPVYLIIMGIVTYAFKRTKRKSLSIIQILLELALSLFLFIVTLIALFGYKVIAMIDGITYTYIALAVFMLVYMITRLYKLYKLIKEY